MSVLTSRAEFIAGANPSSGLPVIFHDGAAYLSFHYFDWGPNWGGVERKTSAETVSEDEVTFTYNNTINDTSTAFTVKGTVTKIADNQLRLTANLTPEGDSALTMAQIGFGLDSFKSIKVTQEDGSENEMEVPIGRAGLGEAVKMAVFTDQDGRTVKMTFDSPTHVGSDGAARMILAKEKMSAGETSGFSVVFEFPEPIKFFSGPESVSGSVEGWYEFTGESPIPSESEWNMSGWLEAPAGKHGRITQKDGVLLYNGAPIKLWGINNSYIGCAPEKELADKKADFYAAMGINAVRLHKYADGTGWAGILSDDDATQFKPEALDRLDYFVAAMKERGIYTKLSPVFIMPIGPANKEQVPFMDEFGKRANGWVKPGHGSFYFSTEIQDLLIEQVKNILNHTNPYTGTKYAEEPAIAYFELYNEDSALWFGVTGTLRSSPAIRERAGALFADWLKEKYQTEEALVAAWGENAINAGFLETPKDESWEENRIYPFGNPWFYDPDNLNTSQASIKERLMDTMLFLYELQNKVYQRYIAAIRETGYEGEIITSNWQAGRAMSHYYNLHSDTMAGTIDRHNYFGGGSNFIIDDRSMVTVPGSGSMSSSVQQVGNRAFMLSEWIHVFPNEWGVEGPAILGAYGMGLQGWDASYAFQNGDNGSFSPGIGAQRWDCTAPQFIGIFPAVSRQVLRGDVKESEVVHYRNVHIPSLADGKVGFGEQVTQSHDVKTFDGQAFPSTALAAARGVVRFTDEFQETEEFPLNEYVEGDKYISSTKQLTWKAGENRRDGFFTIDTPGTQAVVGFARAQTATLADAEITLGSDYGAVYLSAQSVDGKIADDAVLISAISRARNQDMIIAEDTFMFKSGNQRQGPVVMEPVQATIKFKRSGKATVHKLDHNGVRTGDTMEIVNGEFALDTGRDQTPYYLVTW